MFSAQSSTSSRKIDGVMVGIVTDNNDPEGLGRVKVSLPIREVENETDWVRIATLMAGPGRGSYFIPEVGDEVLVAFHLGEVRQPYVIGMLWSQKQPAPNADVIGLKNNNVRKFTSRAGHEISFDDGVIHGKITIKTRRNQVIELDDLMDTVTIHDMKGGNKIDINGMFGKVTISSGFTPMASVAEIKLTSKPPMVSISSKGMINIDATAINVSSKTVLNMEGKAGVNLKSTGPVMINGTIVKIN